MTFGPVKGAREDERDRLALEASNLVQALEVLHQIANVVCLCDCHLERVCACTDSSPPFLRVHNPRCSCHS